MITWTDFSRQQPALADAGRRQFYQFGIGLAFLATVRADGAPRLEQQGQREQPVGTHERKVTPLSLTQDVSDSGVASAR